MMVVGWIYPHRDRCGIARYSNDYAAALDPLVTVSDIDPRWWLHDRKRFRSAVAGCDIIHLQYDTAAYMSGNKDFFMRMMKTLPVAVVVSLHEVYDENPFVFPRTEIRGNALVLPLRRLLWDFRHPVDRASRHHLSHGFGARRILVHHDYHREILTRKGMPEHLITVLPVPMHRISAATPFSPQVPTQLRLGAHGFIQQAFDFDLLFAVLRLLQRPWIFTWVGGTRTENQQSTLRAVRKRISDNGWNDRFRITGWIDEQDIARHLGTIDLVLALFKNRSSSASIARALSHGKPVIATELPLTAEIACGNRTSHRSTISPILTVPAHPDAIVRQIAEFTDNVKARRRLYKGIAAYVDDHSFEKMAQKLTVLYREVLAQ